MTSSYAWWERHGPRLPSHGIKAHTQRGAFARSWWASRWIAALERLVNPGRLARGRTYARAGQVVSLDVTREGVKAVVQGSRPKPYQVHIKFKGLTDAEWERVIDAMSAEALYAARLLSGEMPEQIEDVFASVGTSLLPAERDDMVTTCSCPDLANPCKHIAAVHYLLGERFDEDPFLMFLLRGRSQDEIVAALRARRAGPESESTAEAEPAADVDMATFWSGPPHTHEVALHFALPESDALAVKRLGPPPFARNQTAFSGVMERLYQQIGEYALGLALGEGDIGAGQALRAPTQQDSAGDQQPAHDED
ncbi:MAG: SWIM zinc finger family protein [Chloroflexi bacterium]|nr:SWIM zinc finger family protein [Chloroflexota bacterium]